MISSAHFGVYCFKVFLNSWYPIDFSNKKGRYSCPYEALIDAQAQDLQKTLPTFEKRYNVLVNQMEIRKAPQKQIEQLKKIKQRYEQIVEKANGKEI